MNLSDSIIPKADQINADDLIAEPRTVTITAVNKGNAEQPVNVMTEEFGTGRPYKPSKSMRRVLVAAWGADSVNYLGRQLTLFRNAAIRFGADEVGGIQISHMSHIDGSLKIALTVSRGKRTQFVVQPIATPKQQDTSGRDWLTELATAAQIDKNAVLSLWNAAKEAHANPTVIDLIVKTGKELGEAEKAGKP